MIDLLRLTPTDTAEQLNRTPLGTVCGEEQPRRHLRIAGYRIASGGDGKKINLVRYAAWMLDQIQDRAARIGATKNYEEQKEAARKRSASASESGRDIGPLPSIVDPDRRAKCGESLELFCSTYFSSTFYLEWSADHHKVIKRIETAVRTGGLFALAMPRGEGKTTICERATLWATLYGYRKFVVPIGSSEDASFETISVIKNELEFNDLLFEDFPEVCHPIRKLDGINNRCSGQLLNGERTRISWSGEEIVFPTVPGSSASGAIIKSVGITGRVRGMKKKINGDDVRPDMVLVDDPQTDDSAASPEQTRKRVRILSGAILGLAGPGKKIAGVMPCTVIRPGDMADQILDKEQHPEWNGERLKLLISFPEKMELWHRYREIQIDSYRRYGDNRDATGFYKDHRAEMDAGAESSWPDRFEPGEISGIQYAMNLYFKDQETFFAEYQNEPIPDDDGDVDRITTEQVLERLNHRKRATVPGKATTLTAFVDVQKNLLYYVVCAFAEDFTCWVIDYGAFPDQKRRHFTLGEANPTYGDLFPAAGLEGSVYSALHALTDDMLKRDWPRDDGTQMRIDKCLIDSGWGRSTEAVYRACRESLHAGTLMPSKGVGLTAAQRPITEYKKTIGDKIGFNWWIPSARKKRTSKLMEYDTNFWKSFFRERLLTTPGDPGSFSVWGSDEETHRMFGEQLSSEQSTPTSGRGRKVDVWKMIPNRENHLLDCVVGCMVAASWCGCVLLKYQAAPASRGSIQHVSVKHEPGHGRVFRPGRVHEINGGD